MKYYLVILVLLLISCTKQIEELTWSTSDVNNFDCKDCNIVIISLTNTRYDHLGFNGYERNTSPNLDRLAHSSVVFDNLYAPASWTLPVGISLFSSTMPVNHGVMNRYSGQTRISESLITLPEVLAAQGYKSAAFTGGFDYGDEFGLVSRFSYYKHPVINSTRDYGVVSESIEDASTWIMENKDNKFLIFFQGFDTHCPFTYPQENNEFGKDYSGEIDFARCMWSFDRISPVMIDGKAHFSLKTEYDANLGGSANVLINEDDLKQMIALYDGEIKNADRQLNELLKTIITSGIENRTIVIFLSEHGDMFGKHGRFMRGGPLRGTFYDDVLHVPLVVKHPRLEPRRYDELVEIIDISPSLLDMLGIKIPNEFEGKSIRPIIENNKEIRDYVLAESDYTASSNSSFFNESSKIRAIRNHKYKLIIELLVSSNSTKIELYDVEEDPGELNDISKDNPKIVNDLVEILEHR